MKFKVKIVFLVIFLVFAFSSCASFFPSKKHTQNTSTKTEDETETKADKKTKTEKGIASYYGDKYNGKPTASGENYNSKLLTAAHRTLPFGTIVTVTNLKNGKKTVVKINDRGPFKKERIIDISFLAAQQLDLIRDGITEVEIEYEIE